MDVTDSASVAADRAVAEFGGIDIWVNDAGVFLSIPLLEMKDEDWDAVFVVNARGVLFCASDPSSFMTGSTLLADGGDTA